MVKLLDGGMKMYAKQPKKLMIINILDILRRYTDKEHRLSQKEIAEILKNEYQMKADRKAVKRNLMNLIDFGYDIEYNETIRMTPNAKTGELEESYILSDFYLRREFDDSELRLLIDSLLFSRHIPYSSVKRWWKSWKGCPTSISDPESNTLQPCRMIKPTTNRFF